MLFLHSPEEAQREKRRDFLIHFILFLIFILIPQSTYSVMSNLQARFDLPLRKCTRKYNCQVSELYVFYGMVVGLCGVQNKFSHAPWYIRRRLQDLPQLAQVSRK